MTIKITINTAHDIAHVPMLQLNIDLYDWDHRLKDTEIKRHIEKIYNQTYLPELKSAVNEMIKQVDELNRQYENIFNEVLREMNNEHSTGN